jgi:hypothetical protein
MSAHTAYAVTDQEPVEMPVAVTVQAPVPDNWPCPAGGTGFEVTIEKAPIPVGVMSPPPPMAARPVGHTTCSVLLVPFDEELVAWTYCTERT